MLVSCAQMKAVEAAAFARGITADHLMESAGESITHAILDFFPSPRHVIAFCGKGNNAGDVLVAARHLAQRGWSVELDFAFPENDLSPLCSSKLLEFRSIAKTNRRNQKFPIVLDGLLGIGAQGPPREPIASAIRRIEALRIQRGAFVVAADIPSGLNGDSGEAADPCVVADLTVTIGHTKIGLIADAATNFVGRLALASLPELATDIGDPAELVTPDLLHPLLSPRPFNSHKGMWGRVGIIAGSRGFLGAARMSSEAALHAGAGLVTLYATSDIYDLLASSTAPEIMVQEVSDYLSVLDDQLDAVGMGPGIGMKQNSEIRDLVIQMPCPMVVDADALNLLASTPQVWQKVAGPRLLTPHPGEMARLFPDGINLPRRQIAEHYVAIYGITLLLKGARSIIAEHNSPTAYNTTGNPGMGSGGMGDVLTGVCAALMAGKQSPKNAAMLGAWLCGRAAELSVFSPGGSPESLIASDVIHYLGAAFQELRGG